MSPKYFQTPFAGNGNKAAIADLTQPDGIVSYQEGFGGDYAKNPVESGAKFIDRSQMNGLLNDITGNLKQWQEQGYYNYNPAIKYGIGGRCNYDDGTGLKAYVSTTDNNTRVPSVNGVVQSGWILADLPPSIQNNMLVGQPNGAGYVLNTPAQVAALLGIPNLQNQINWIKVRPFWLTVAHNGTAIPWKTKVDLSAHLPPGAVLFGGWGGFVSTQQGGSDLFVGSDWIDHAPVCSTNNGFGTSGHFVLATYAQTMYVGNPNTVGGVISQSIVVNWYVSLF